jgi:hypothetical protein
MSVIFVFPSVPLAQTRKPDPIITIAQVGSNAQAASLNSAGLKTPSIESLMTNPDMQAKLVAFNSSVAALQSSPVVQQGKAAHLKAVAAYLSSAEAAAQKRLQDAFVKSLVLQALPKIP